MDRSGRRLSRRSIVGGIGALVGVAASNVGGRAQAGGVQSSAVQPVAQLATAVTRVLTVTSADFGPTNYPIANQANLTILADGGIRGNAAALATIVAPVHLPAGVTITKVDFITKFAATGVPVSLKSIDCTTQTVTVIRTAMSSVSGSVATVSLSTNHVVQEALGYTVEVTSIFGSDTVYGVQITYIEPAVADPLPPFVAINPTKRVFNSRDSGAPKLAAGEERIVPLSVPAGRTAVINLTITETEGNGGFIAVFPANVVWPGNSSINWFGTNQNLANTTLCLTDASGQIRIRGGSAPAHVIVDVIGYLN